MHRFRQFGRSIAGALRRVTGVSTPIGGLSWTLPPSEREELRRLVVFLEDRRALFDPYNVEAVVLVEQSVQEIRAELTGVLQRLDEDSSAAEPLRTMRAAAQRYLTRASDFSNHGGWRRPPRFYPDEDGDDFILALGELRGAFAAAISQIASRYEIAVHGELAGLLE